MVVLFAYAFIMELSFNILWRLFDPIILTFQELIYDILEGKTADITSIII